MLQKFLLKRLVMALAMPALLFGAWLHADETRKDGATDEPAAASAPASGGAAESGDLPALIKQLDADEFSSRRDASAKLQQLGKAAIPALQQAALGDSREVTTRSLEILEKHFSGGDEEAKAAAKAALQQIADSKHMAARRAKDILNPPPPQPEQVARAIRLAPGAIQIQVQAAAGNGVVRRMKIANGVKEIEVDENGQKVKILEDPQKGIEVESTEKVDGKEVTKKYAAKNIEELKKNHPDGYKLYEKHNQNQAGVRINGLQLLPQAIPVPGQALPVPVPAPFQNGAQNREQILKRTAALQVGHAERMLQSTAQLLKQLKADGVQDAGESLEKLEKIQEQLREAKAKLETQPQNNGPPAAPAVPAVPVEKVEKIEVQVEAQAEAIPVKPAP